MSHTPDRNPHPILRVGLALTLFNSWVLFEELVVDRLGWWRHMPCYRVGRFCEWDVGAIVLIVTVTLLAFADTRTWLARPLRSLCGRVGCRACRAA